MELSRQKIKEFVEHCSIFTDNVNEYIENLDLDKNDEKSLNIFCEKKDQVESFYVRLECIKIHLELNFDYDIYETTNTLSNYFSQNTPEGYIKKIDALLLELRFLKEDMNYYFLADLPKMKNRPGRKNENATGSLSEKETAKFFQLLQRVKLITNKNNLAVSESVSLLTGYGKDNMIKNIPNVTLNTDEKTNLQNFLRSLLNESGKI